MKLRGHLLIVINLNFVEIPIIPSIVFVRRPERKKLMHKINQVNNFIYLSKPTWNWINLRTRIGQHRGNFHQRKMLLVGKGLGPKIRITKMMRIHYPNHNNQNGQNTTWSSHQNPHQVLVHIQLTQFMLPPSKRLTNKMNHFQKS